MPLPTTRPELLRTGDGPRQVLKQAILRPMQLIPRLLRIEDFSVSSVTKEKGLAHL